MLHDKGIGINEEGKIQYICSKCIDKKQDKYFKHLNHATKSLSSDPSISKSPKVLLCPISGPFSLYFVKYSVPIHSLSLIFERRYKGLLCPKKSKKGCIPVDI